MSALVITAAGVVCGAGNLDGLWESCLQSRHHLESLEDGTEDRPPRLVSRVRENLEGLFPRRVEPGASRHSRLAARALIDCLADDQGAESPAGLVFCSAAQGQDLAERVWPTLRTTDVRDMDQEGLRTLTNSGAAQLLAARFSCAGFVQSVDGASAAGMLSLQAAALALHAGLARRVMVVSGEANLYDASLAFYEKKILLGGATHTFFGRRKDPRPRELDQAIVPFGSLEHSDRGALGEAGVALCLETLASAHDRGARILAHLSDVRTHFHTEGYHGTDRAFAGLAKVLEPFQGQSLDSLHLPICGSWVLDHGPILAASRLFPGCHAHSPEPLVGHAGAASSLLNLALAVRALQHRVLLPTRGLNANGMDPDCTLTPSTLPLDAPEIRRVGVVSCGWGGWNAAAVLERA
ncbi:MAG: hypothetical protein IPN71_02780 [Fibrobacteres bacterium]|nr:hypothetical protein [Fibrobacterota bacterium]MBK9576431.1 hypothetical protein [Fibrobacterota bacterium]QQS05481.1 MAG: hypothetical protein IPK50_00950 [Fibrobacterota bacterium]